MLAIFVIWKYKWQFITGLFEYSHMEFNAERGAVNDADEEATAGVSVKADDPSLADMTRTALSILSKNEKGFFLLIEGELVKLCILFSKFASWLPQIPDIMDHFSWEFIMWSAFGGYYTISVNYISTSILIAYSWVQCVFCWANSYFDKVDFAWATWNFYWDYDETVREM